MRKTSFLCTVLFTGLLLSCNSQAAKEKNRQGDSADAKTKAGEEVDPRYQVTPQAFGLVKLTDTYDDIVKTYHKEGVTEEEMNRAPDSDETVMKTIVNKGRNDEMVIQWADDAFHKKIIAIEASQKNHPFTTPDGVHYGTTLTELVKTNGAKVGFSGFGWDFGGRLNNYFGGKLAYKEGQPTISFEIDINATQSYTDIEGDQQLDTDMPKTKKFLDNIFVSTIHLSPAL